MNQSTAGLSPAVRIPWAERIVAATAAGVSRRAFLSNLGRVAFVAGLGTALAGSGLMQLATATGTCSSPCGPSPLCPSGRCGGSCGCKNDVDSFYRWYESSTCKTGCGAHYWDEPYCGSSCGFGGNAYWRCHDCCATGGGGGFCSNCAANPRYACICRVQLYSC